MLPPRTVYSLVISNRNDKKTTVKVSYTDADGAVSHVNISVPANGTATAPEQTYQRGSAVFVKEITKVETVSTRSRCAASSISAPFPSVTSPTSHYPIEIAQSCGGLVVRYQPAN